MLQTLSLEIQNAINEVNEAREFYYFAKFQSETAWNDYSNYVDQDPRWENPNLNDAEMENHRNKCSELLAWAEIYEKEVKDAWHQLDKAKANLLKLQEEVR